MTNAALSNTVFASMWSTVEAIVNSVCSVVAEGFGPRIGGAIGAGIILGELGRGRDKLLL